MGRFLESVYFYLLSLIFFGLGLGATCFAESPLTNNTALDTLSESAKKTLEEKFSSPEARANIRFPGIEKLAQNPNFSDVTEIKDVRYIQEKSPGIASFSVTCISGENESTKVVHLPFEAWVKVPVATHRIYPNTKLKSEDFKVQSVNVATGTPREYRGIFASPTFQPLQTQSKQTILEGQFLTTSATQREPDVRRGELVRLELVSGDLSLTTQAVAQEPGAVGERIHVLSGKTKKDIYGIVREDHTIEVKL